MQNIKIICNGIDTGLFICLNTVFIKYRTSVERDAGISKNPKVITKE
jgi:hypothetical protein